MKNNKGITLVETVVAVTVLIFALGGPFLLAARSLHSAGYAREEVAAARLAEEGLEIIHNMRDNNSVDGAGWNAEISNCTQGCIIDVTKVQKTAGAIWPAGSLVSCGGTCTGEQHRVYVHTASGLYRQFSGAAPSGYAKTSMTRYVKVTAVNSAEREYTVESTVTFNIGKQVRTITLNDTIMNWFPSKNNNYL